MADSARSKDLDPVHHGRGAQIPNPALASVSSKALPVLAAPSPQHPACDENQSTSIIVGSFGFSTLGTQYLQIPAGAVQFLSLLAGGYICTRWPRNSRCIMMTVANTICILGAGLLISLPDSNKWGRLVALWLCFFQGSASA